MTYISFDPLRTLGFNNTQNLKAEDYLNHRDAITNADWVLFPEYWQINSLIYGLKANVFPSHASYLLGHNKIEMTRAFKTVAPEHTPATLICANTPENAERVWNEQVIPFVAKLPKSAQGMGVWLINTREEWQDYQTKTDVLYVQEYLPIEKDMRIVYIGNQIFTQYWRKQSDNGFHNNVSRGGEIVHDKVPVSAMDLVCKLATTLNINHAGFDIAMIGDYPFVLEFNRIFGNAGINNQALQQSILTYLQENTIKK